MSGTDVGLRFWLRYVEAHGGLTDDAGQAALVVLPPGLQALHELPEELVVTGDPDVAREDGATFLAAGHPVLGQAADDVLASGDVARVTIPAPATVPPEAAALLAVAREQFPVDHGRIDASGAPTRAIRSVLRVGALVSYSLSADDHFQERAECWIDADSRSELADPSSAKLARLPTVRSDGPPRLDRLTSAIGEAHRTISAGVERRRACLSGDIAKSMEAELERAQAYYRDVLAATAKRRASAPADRWELLDARVDATRDERGRRLAEIREKFRPAHQIRPYRLHVYELPVWRLSVDVRRGERRYPLTLDYMLSLARFAEIRCPHCDALERLVAGKAWLGCTACLDKPAVRLIPDPPAAARKPAQPAQRVPDPQPAKPKDERPPQQVDRAPTTERRPTRIARPATATATHHLRAKIAKAGDKLSGRVWDAVVNGDRRMSRMCAPDSPAAAATRLYGPVGAARAIGLPPGEPLVASGSGTTPEDPGALQATRGFVETALGRRFPYLLWWKMVGDTPIIDEILPYQAAVAPDRLPKWVVGPGLTGLFAPPQPRIPLGPVGELLWRRVGPHHGLPVVLRCLAAWWRLPDESTLTALHGPAALAAGIERMVCQRTGGSGGRYAEVAFAYRVDEGKVRTAGADLQGRLGLSPTTLW